MTRFQLLYERALSLTGKVNLVARMISIGVLPTKRHRLRRILAEKYLQGSGIEIGGLQLPVPMPKGVSVKYVDMLTVEEQRRRFPEIQNAKLAMPDIIDDGETLSSIPDTSVDFIIANHVLEHFENPCGAIRIHLRKLSPKGILYYSIPDKRLTFDHKRPLTSFEHIVNEDKRGVESGRYSHYYEFTKLTSNLVDEHEIEMEAKRLMEMHYRIHFHVWDNNSYRDFLFNLSKYLQPSFQVLYVGQNGVELVAILQKASDT